MPRPEPFQYKQLENRTEYIRLLELQDAVDDEDTLHGTFTFKKISEHADDLNYAALSYHWGTEVLEDKIMIESRYIKIRANLASALRFFRKRYRGTVKYIWVDAVCINQQDLIERSSQVSVMAKIYHGAVNVLVWLGEGDNNSDLAMRFVRDVLNLKDFDRLIRDPNTPKKWDALSTIMRKKWFSRRWVIQEIAHAENAVLCCGHSEIKWDEFADAIGLFVDKAHEVKRLFQRDSEFHNNPSFLGEVDALAATELVKITTHLFRRAIRPTQDKGTQQPKQPVESLQPLQSLEDLISLFLSFEVSNPRDIVYAILSLSKDTKPSWHLKPLTDTTTLVAQAKDLLTNSEHDANGRKAKIAQKVAAAAVNFEQLVASKQFEIDYQKSAFDVYKELVAHIISKSQSLDIICLPWAIEDAPLPSWVGRLSQKPFALDGENKAQRVYANPLVGAQYQGIRKYRASGNTKATEDEVFPRELTDSDNVLFAKGFKIGQVSETKGVAFSGVIPASWLELANWNNVNDLPPDAFWRTLIADRAHDGSNPPSWYRRACQEFWKILPARSSANVVWEVQKIQFSTIRTFLNRVSEVVWGRMMIRTDDGHLGLAPEDTKASDLICILHGCSVPVILRKVEIPVAQPTTQKRSASYQRRRASLDVRMINNQTAGAGFEDGLKGDTGPNTKRRRIADPALRLNTTNLLDAPITRSPQSLSPQIIVESPVSEPSEKGQTDSSIASTGYAKSEVLEMGEANNMSDSRYTLVGACYIHGYMDGEAIDRYPGSFPTQHFGIE